MSIPAINAYHPHHSSNVQNLLNQIKEQQSASFFIGLGESKDEKDNKKAKLRHKQIHEEREIVLDSASFQQEISKSLASQSQKISHLR